MLMTDTQNDEMPAPVTRRHLGVLERPGVRRAVARWLGPLILVVVAFVSVGVHVTSFTTISPVDELTHIDSLFRAPAPVHSGEKVGEAAMREQACRGLINFSSPACNTPGNLSPEYFQELGYNTGAVYTPLYYTLTKVVAVPLKFVTGIESLVTAARLVGALWLAGGMLLTYLVGRRLGAPRTALTSILILVAVSPSILFPSATVTPDATGLLAGAAIIWALLVWEDNPRRNWWVPVIIAVLVAALKTVNIVAILMAGCFVLVRLVTSWYAERQDAPMEGYLTKPDRRRILFGGVGVAASTLAVLVGWSAYVSASEVGSAADAPMNVRSVVSSISLDSLLVSLGQFLNPLDGAGNVVITEMAGYTTQRLVGMLLIAGVIAGAAFALGTHQHRALGQGAFLAGLLGGPLMTLFIFLLHGSYIGMPGRYAITLAPAAIVLAASFMRARSVQIVCAAAAAIAWVWTLSALL